MVSEVQEEDLDSWKQIKVCDAERKRAEYAFPKEKKSLRQGS